MAICQRSSKIINLYIKIQKGDHQMLGATSKLTTKSDKNQLELDLGQDLSCKSCHYVYKTYESCSRKKGKASKSQISWTTKSNHSKLHTNLNPSGWLFQPAYKPIKKSSAQSGWKASVSDFLSPLIPEPHPQIQQISKEPMNPKYPK